MADPALPKDPLRISSRHEFVVERCVGQSVLHVGCVDSGLFEERRRSGELLHLKLLPAAETLVGVDIDVEGLAQLASLAAGDGLLSADICDPDWVHELPKGIKFDVIVLSEVLEHLGNPEAALQSIAVLAARDGAEVVITVPNAFRVQTLLTLLRNKESVHPDHFYWFSYTTLQRLLDHCGYRTQVVGVYSFESLRLFPYATRASLRAWPRALPRRLLTRFLYRRSPFFSDGLVFVVHAGR